MLLGTVLISLITLVVFTVCYATGLPFAASFVVALLVVPIFLTAIVEASVSANKR